MLVVVYVDEINIMTLSSTVLLIHPLLLYIVVGNKNRTKPVTLPFINSTVAVTEKNGRPKHDLLIGTA